MLRIAQAQMPVPPTIEVAINDVRNAARTAVQSNARLLALPEMFCCPYRTDAFPVYAQEEGGPLWQSLSQIAKEFGLYLFAGTVPEREVSADGQRIYNTAYVFSPSGEQIAKHRKMHLFDIDVKGGQRFFESDVLTGGNNITVFDTELCRFGLAICYDVRFPELFRLMALQGAEVILVPAAFNMTTGPKHWELLFRSQALNNQVFVVGTAPARDEASSYVSWGHSIVASPWGEVLFQADEKEGLFITDLPLRQIKEVREQIPVLKHRRTDVYKLHEVHMPCRHT